MEMHKNFVFLLNLELAAMLLLSCTLSVGDSYGNGFNVADSHSNAGTVSLGRYVPEFRPALGYSSRADPRRQDVVVKEPGYARNDAGDIVNDAVQLRNTGEIVLNDVVYGSAGARVFPRVHVITAREKQGKNRGTLRAPAARGYPRLRVHTAREYFNPIHKYKDKLRVRASPRKQMKRRMQRGEASEEPAQGTRDLDAASGRDVTGNASVDVKPRSTAWTVVRQAAMESALLHQLIPTAPTVFGEDGAASGGSNASVQRRNAVRASSETSARPRGNNNSSSNSSNGGSSRNKPQHTRGQARDPLLGSNRTPQEAPQVSLTQRYKEAQGPSAQVSVSSRQSGSPSRLPGTLRRGGGVPAPPLALPVPIADVPPHIQQLYWLVIQQREASRMLRAQLRETHAQTPFAAARAHTGRGHGQNATSSRAAQQRVVQQHKLYR